ncbi:MAG: carboxypeptidase regulatory-like domain-containing protein [Acidobacteria bacterium]|nr:carboxypeptidase regulatory-like domain-containing protein [Acidobacteriota bacterium]
MGLAVVVAVPCGRVPAAEIPVEDPLEGRTRAAGWIIDPGGRPVAGVEIWVVPDYYGDITSATFEAGPAAVTGPDGSYDLRDRTVGGSERLRACRQGYVPKEFPAKRPVSEALWTVLTPVIHLAGHVVDAKGEPLSDARIFAGLYGPPPGDLILPDPPCQFDSSALSGPGGAFTVELEAPGLYEVTATRSGYLSTSLRDFTIPPEGLAGVEIRLDSGTTVSGHVTDPEGRSIAYASITMRGPRSHAEVTADQDGKFLVEGIEPGEPRLEVSYTGYATKEVSLQVPPGGTQVDVVLDPTSYREIRGRVVGPDGAPIGEALIHISSLFQRLQATTLADGSFVVEVSKDVYRLKIEKAGFAPQEIEGVAVDATSVEGLEIRLGYGRTLKGHILGIDPKTLKRLEVSDAVSTHDISVDSEGRFEVHDLAPGEWSLGAEAAADRFVLEKLTPPPGLKEVVHDLQFPPVFKVRGRVTGPRGEPIEGADLWFSGSPGVHFQAQTLADGSFTVGVTNDTYTLHVSAGGYSSREPEQPIVVAGETVAGVEIQLGTNIVLTGRLLGLEPAETIGSLGAKGPPGYLAGAWSADQGQYRLTGLWPGDWTVTATRARHSWMEPDRMASGKIHIPPGTTEATLDLDFHVGDLTLTVRSAHPGEPFRATLLYADGSELIKDPLYGHDEVFHFERLQAGTYRLRIEDLRKKVQEQPVELTADREVVIDPAAAP